MRRILKNQKALTPRLTLLLAVTSGVSVANLYYAQPLLPKLSELFHASSSSVAFVITASQIGYALGLLFLLPLGDLLKRKWLIICGVFLGAAALALLSTAHTLTLFELFSLLTGFSSVVAQIVVPLAADLSPPHQSGKTVGTVMSGLLVGILLARTFSGIIADALGTRAVYLIAAAVMALLGIALLQMLPDIQPKHPEGNITTILSSTIRIFLGNKILQLRAVYGMLSFLAFTMLWTSLSFYLASSPYNYSPRTIGLFGLLGVAGALAARFTGHATDMGRVRLTTGLGGILIIVGFAGSYILGNHLWMLVIAIVALDAAFQTVHISNQSVIYREMPAARSRVNSSYMTLYFVGGASGSAIAGWAWQHGGWAATTAVGAASGALILIIWHFDRFSMGPSAST